MSKYVIKNAWRESVADFLKRKGFTGPPRYYIRQIILDTIIKVAKKDERICFIGADFPGELPYVTEGIPLNRVINLGIAEPNVVTVASGWANEGYIPIIMSMGWLYGRAYNQIFQSVGIDNHNVKFLGFARAWAGGGASHHEINDIGFMRSIPQMLILAPADDVELEKALIASLKYHGSTYLRIIGVPTANLFEENYPYHLGKAVTVREGEDVSIISYGIMLWRSLEASDILAEEGIDARVINMNTIKPLDEQIILKAARETGTIVTAEDHSIMTGVGEAVTRVLAKTYPVPVEMVGIRDLYSQSTMDKPGGWEILEKAYHLSAEDVAAATRTAVKRK
jgi:transketolase